MSRFERVKCRSRDATLSQGHWAALVLLETTAQKRVTGRLASLLNQSCHQYFCLSRSPTLTFLGECMFQGVRQHHLFSSPAACYMFRAQASDTPITPEHDPSSGRSNLSNLTIGF